MGRIAWLLALCGLLLLVTVSARHQVLQWGQQPIRPAGSAMNQAFASSNTFGEPQWLPANILGAEEVDDIRAGPAGSLLWKTVSGKWFLSGAYQYDNAGAVPSFYYPVEQDFTATTFDSNKYPWNLYDVHFAPGPNGYSTPSTTNQVFAFGNSTVTSTNWLFQSFTQFYADNPSSFTVDEAITSNLTCVHGVCAFVASGNAYVYGYFESVTDPMLGPGRDSEDSQVSGYAARPKWNNLCGNLSSIPTTVTDIHVGFDFIAAVADPVPGVSYQTINLWGTNTVGQLGNSNLGATCGSFAVTSDYFTGLPANAKLTRFSAGSLHNLALFSNGAVYAWGDNSRGQLGVSPSIMAYSTTPLKITFPGAPTITYVSAWGQSSFAADATGAIYAWGSNAAPPANAPLVTPIGVFDEAIGVLGFGKARPTLTYLSTPTRMPLPLPSGAKLLKIVKPWLWDSNVGYDGLNGDCTVNFIFDVPAPASSPITSNDPYLKPVAVGDTVLMTWGSPQFTGVNDFVETRPVPRPVPADFSRSIPLSSIGPITTTGRMIYVQNNASNNFWYFGTNEGRLPASGMPTYIRTPYNSANTSEGISMNATLRTIHTAATTIFYNPSSSGAPPFTCVPKAQIGSDFTYSYLTSSDYASSKTIKNVIGGPQHFVIEYTDKSFQTCTANCQDAIANGDNSFLGRNGDLSKCGYPTALGTDFPFRVAVGDGVTAAWSCDSSVGGTCLLATFGSNTLGAPGGATDGTRNNVNIDNVPLGPTASYLAVNALECGYHFCAAVLSNDAVIGWGEIFTQDGDEGEFAVGVTLISANSFGAGETITQISAISRALFILTNKGRIYAFGQGQGGGDGNDGFMAFFPFNKPIISRPSNQFGWLQDLQKVNGVYYNYTRLMTSSAFGDMYSPMVALGQAIEEPVAQPFTKKDAEYSPTSFSTDSLLYGWGTNVGVTSSLNSVLTRSNMLLQTDDATPLLTKPTLMFPSIYNDYGAGLPFDPLTANITWGRHHAYALTPEGDVYYWGVRPFYQVHPSAPVYDASANGPMLLMRDVAKIAALEQGVVYLQKDGVVACSASPTSTSACSGNSNSSTNAVSIFYYSPTAEGLNPPLGAFTDIHCSTMDTSTICVALWNNSAYSIMATYSGFQPPVAISGIPSILSAWVAGANFNTNTTTPYYHWIYNRFDMTAGTDVPSLGWSSYEAPQLINEVGIDAVNVAKVVVGAEHVLVLLRNGSLVGWGWTSFGQLGSFASDPVLTAVPVLASKFGNAQGLTQVADIAASNFASMVLSTTGEVYTWGADGQVVPTDTSAFKVSLMMSLSVSNYGDEGTAWNVLSSAIPKLVASNPNFIKLISGPSTGFQGSFPTTTSRFMVVSRGLVVEPITPISTPVSPPSSQCPPPRPSLATCALFNGKYQWVVTQASLAANNRSTIVISNNVLIDGDLTISDETPIQIRALSGGDLPLINVTGHTNVTSPITIKLDDDDVKAISKKSGSQTANTTVLESSSLSLSTSPSSAVKVDSSAKKCRKVSSKTTQTNSEGHSGLTTLISVDSGSCNNWWIILVSVVGGIVVLVLIFLIVYFSSSKVQGVFRPFKGSGARLGTTTNLS